MTPTEILAAVRAVVEAGEKATPGPWEPNAWYGTEEGGWCGVGPHVNDSDDEIDDPDGENCARANRDAALIAHAGTHYATLARALIQALDEREALLDDLPHAVGRCDCDPLFVSTDDGCRWTWTDAHRAAIARLEGRLK